MKNFQTEREEINEEEKQVDTKEEIKVEEEIIDEDDQVVNPVWKLNEGIKKLGAFISDETADKSSHFQVGWNISEKEFVAITTDKGRKDRAIQGVRLMYKQSSVFMYEVPSGPHEVIWPKIVLALANLDPHCIMHTALSMHFGGIIKEPDGSILPIGLAPAGNPCNPAGLAWPTLALEVGWSESVQDLDNDANIWLGPATGIQVVLVFKLWPVRANGTAQMLAMRYERGAVNPVYAVSFGTGGMVAQTANVVNGLGGAAVVGVGRGGPACNAINLAPYMFQVPIALLFLGVPVPAAFAAVAQLDLDLFPLQQRVMQTY